MHNQNERQKANFEQYSQEALHCMYGLQYDSWLIFGAWTLHLKSQLVKSHECMLAIWCLRP